MEANISAKCTLCLDCNQREVFRAGSVDTDHEMDDGPYSQMAWFGDEYMEYEEVELIGQVHDNNDMAGVSQDWWEWQPDASRQELNTGPDDRQDTRLRPVGLDPQVTGGERLDQNGKEELS
jgi:hypothetical protein